MAYFLLAALVAALPYNGRAGNRPATLLAGVFLTAGFLVGAVFGIPRY